MGRSTASEKEVGFGHGLPFAKSPQVPVNVDGSPFRESVGLEIWDPEEAKQFSQS